MVTLFVQFFQSYFNIEKSKKVISTLFLGTLASILAFFILNNFPSTNEKITYKGSTIVIPKESSEILTHAIENINSKDFQDAYSEADGYLKYAVSKNYSPEVISLCYCIKGECSFNLGDFEKAELELNLGLQKYESIEILHLLSKVYFKRFKETDSKDYLKKYEKVIDKLHKKLKISSIKLGVKDVSFLPYDKIISKKKLYIISIGINSYYDSDLPKLKFAEKDAKDFIKAFEKYSSYREINSKLITGRNVTKERVDSLIADIKENIKKEDILMFYFSGHGLNSDKIYNSKKLDKRLLLQDYSFSKELTKDYLSLNEIYKSLNNINTNSEKLIVLDACSNGQKEIKNVKLKLIRSILEKKKSSTICFSSSSYGEKSIESDKLKNGVFTHFLIDGIKRQKQIDKNNDNVLSLFELSDYIQEKISLNYLNFKQTVSIMDFQ